MQLRSKRLSSLIALALLAISDVYAQVPDALADIAPAVDDEPSQHESLGENLDRMPLDVLCDGILKSSDPRDIRRSLRAHPNASRCYDMPGFAERVHAASQNPLMDAMRNGAKLNQVQPFLNQATPQQVKGAMTVAARQQDPASITALLQHAQSMTANGVESGAFRDGMKAVVRHHQGDEQVNRALRDWDFKGDHGTIANLALSAARQGNAELVDGLLGQVQDEDIKDTLAKNAFDAAVKHDHTSAIRTLMENHISKGKDDEQVIKARDEAAKKGRDKVIDGIVGDKDIDGRIRVAENALQAGHPALARTMLQNTDDKLGYTSGIVTHAADSGHFDIMHKALEHSPLSAQSALMSLAGHGKAEELKSVLKKYPDAAKSKNIVGGAVHDAAQNNHQDVIDVLKDAVKGDKEKTDEIHSRLLDWRATTGNAKEAARILKENPHLPVRRALQEAASNGHDDTFHHLLGHAEKSGAKLDERELAGASGEGGNRKIIDTVLSKAGGDSSLLNNVVAGAAVKGHMDVARDYFPMRKNDPLFDRQMVRYSIQGGKADAAKFYLKHVPHQNLDPKQVHESIKVAIENGHVDAYKALTPHIGAYRVYNNQQERNQNMLEELQHAIDHKQYDIVKHILGAARLPPQILERQFSDASKRGDFKLAAIIHDAIANEKKTAGLELAMDDGKPAAINHLLKDPTLSRSALQRAADGALRLGRYDAVKNMMDHPSGLNDETVANAVSHSIHYGDGKLFWHALKRDKSSDQLVSTAMNAAAATGRTDILDALNKHRVKPGVLDRSNAMFHAVRGNQEGSVKTLLEQHPAPSVVDMGLHHSAASGHVHLMDHVLAHNPSRAMIEEAVKSASTNNKGEAVNRLLEHGDGDQELVDQAVKRASSYNNDDVLRRVSQAGHRASEGAVKEAMKAAAKKGSLDAIQHLLLSSHPSLEVVDSAALEAAKAGQVAVYETLIENGRRPSMPALKASLGIARKNGHADLAEYLTQRVQSSQQ